MLKRFERTRSKDDLRLLPFIVAKNILLDSEASNNEVARRFLNSDKPLFVGPMVQEADPEYPGISSKELAEFTLHLYVEQQQQIKDLTARLKKFEATGKVAAGSESGLIEKESKYRRRISEIVVRSSLLKRLGLRPVLYKLLLPADFDPVRGWNCKGTWLPWFGHHIHSSRSTLCRAHRKQAKPRRLGRS